MEKGRTKLKGKSGFDWELRGVFDPETDITAVDVFCGLDGSPVISYVQAGNDKSTRKLTVTKTTESRTLARARADFGV